MECSNCAESDLFRVTAVQSSAENFGLGTAEIGYRYDGEEHALFMPRPMPRAPVLQDTWRRMEDVPQPMTAEIAQNRHALALDIALHRVPDIAEGLPAYTLSGKNIIKIYTPKSAINMGNMGKNKEGNQKSSLDNAREKI